MLTSHAWLTESKELEEKVYCLLNITSDKNFSYIERVALITLLWRQKEPKRKKREREVFHSYIFLS